jgi:hypothetical protein
MNASAMYEHLPRQALTRPEMRPFISLKCAQSDVQEECSDSASWRSRAACILPNGLSRLYNDRLAQVLGGSEGGILPFDLDIPPPSLLFLCIIC